MDHHEDKMEVDFFPQDRPSPLAEEAFKIQRETRKRLFGDIDIELQQPQPVSPSASAPATVQQVAPGQRKVFSNPFAKLFKNNTGMPHADSGTAVQADVLAQIAQQYPTLFHLYCHGQFTKLTQEKLRVVANQQLRALNFEPVALVDSSDVLENLKRFKVADLASKVNSSVRRLFSTKAEPSRPTMMPELAMCPPEIHARTIRELFALGPVVTSDKFPSPFGSTIRLPLIINELVAALLHPQSVTTDGIFRLAGSGNEGLLSAWIASIGSQQSAGSLLNVSPHDFATMHKRWLVSGESEDDRLFPIAHSRAVEAISTKYTSKEIDVGSAALALRAVIQCLDAEHQYVLAAVVLIARSVIAHHANTRMDAENLARVFAPNVFAFRGPMTLAATKLAIAALNIIFSDPNIVFWFAPISHEPFVFPPSAPQPAL